MNIAKIRRMAHPTVNACGHDLVTWFETDVIAPKWAKRSNGEQAEHHTRSKKKEPDREVSQRPRAR